MKAKRYSVRIVEDGKPDKTIETELVFPRLVTEIFYRRKLHRAHYIDGEWVANITPWKVSESTLDHYDFKEGADKQEPDDWLKRMTKEKGGNLH
jgi:hypothetical protein